VQSDLLDDDDPPVQSDLLDDDDPWIRTTNITPSEKLPTLMKLRLLKTLHRNKEIEE